MKTAFKKIIASSLLVFIVVDVNANGLNKLLKFIDQTGGMSNYNAPRIIRDQQGGFMTGGSLQIRGARPKTLQPAHVQLPSFGFDACTGSGDFRFGGLSFINSAEFSAFMKKLTTTTGAYAFKMAAKSFCPQCENIIAEFEAIARDINNFNLERCGAAKQLAGGLFGQLGAGQEQSCLMQNAALKNGTDLYKANQICANGASPYGDPADTEELKSLLGDNFNLVWKALSKGSIDSVEFKELMMSVAGSLIAQKIEGGLNLKPLASLVVDSSLLEKYIGTKGESSRVEMYVCDEKEKCLNPQIEVKVLTVKDTLYGKIGTILDSLVDKVEADIKNPVLSDEEEALIEYSSIPIIPLIQQELARHGDKGNIFLRNAEFIDVICYEVMSGFFEGIIHKTLKEVRALEFAQVDSGKIERYLDTAQEVLSMLRHTKEHAYSRLVVIMQAKERLRQQEAEFDLIFEKLGA
jgi:conjugative transfer pilus assembly protein TraH